MTESARVVIIGGGIVGCSTAYHLAKMGEKDVLLLEKGELTSGSTWHAAGLVGQLRSNRNITRLLGYSVELYQKLEHETGQATGWKQVGGLRLACTKDRMTELKRSATMAKSFGMEMHLISAEEARDLFPLISIHDVLGAAFIPTDGYADPAGIALALAKGAASAGVKIKRNQMVTGIIVKNGRVTGVKTDAGVIQADVVVNCAGMWARQVGRLAGVNVPLIPVQHQYMVSDRIPNMPTGLPTLRDPDRLIYYKEEMGGLVMGGYEPNPIPWSIYGVPLQFGQELLESDFDHFQPISEAAIARTPCLAQAGVRRLINGPEAFTPDGQFILGEAPEVRNFFVGAGFNAHGIASGGGAGRMLAEWVLNGEPSMDMWVSDIRRFGPHARATPYIRDRTCELYGKHYTISWPHEEHSTARGLRRSPLYPLLKSKGAVFGAKFGWERPNWFARPGDVAQDVYSFERPNWHDAVGSECRAIREGVGLIDQSSFSKFLVGGPGAKDFLQFMAVANIDKPEGSLTYTQLCDQKGGIQCDLTIVRLSAERFYIITGTAFAVHDFEWLKKHLPTDGSVYLEDITPSRAVINVCGPRSRALIQQITEFDMSNANFKFGQAREIVIGSASVLALRVTYVGELGWELHIPTEFAVDVYQQLWDEGQAFGVVNAGYRAIESLRLEKGYLYWSGDITPDYNPYEAGLGFTVSKTKSHFLGCDALRAIREKPLKQKMATFVLSEAVELQGGEALCHEGRAISVVTSGGYGHYTQRSIAFAYVPTEHEHHLSFEIEARGQRVVAERIAGCLYDPERKKIVG